MAVYLSVKLKISYIHVGFSYFDEMVSFSSVVD